MSESEEDKAKGLAWYPFRDYASVTPKSRISGEKAGTNDASITREMAVLKHELSILRIQYKSKCIELARLQFSHGMLEDQLHALVRSSHKGPGEPGVSRSAKAWCSSLLASVASLLHR